MSPGSPDPAPNAAPDVEPAALSTVVREVLWPYGAFRRVRSPLQRRVRRAKRLVTAVLVVYAALVAFPHPLFAETLRVDNLTLCAQQPLDDRARAVLVDARERVARSEFFRADAPHRVFLCDGWLPYRLFQPVGGADAYASANPLTRNLFVAHPDLAAGLAFRDGGRRAPRSLAAVIAHEVSHDLLREHFGLWRTLALPRWKEEGYCEYIARDSSFDFTRGLVLLADGRSEPGPAFRYYRWRVLAMFALDHRHLSASAFFADDVRESDLEAQMLAALHDGSFAPREV